MLKLELYEVNYIGNDRSQRSTLFLCYVVPAPVAFLDRSQLPARGHHPAGVPSSESLSPLVEVSPNLIANALDELTLPL